jgi:hypothetical protein
VFKDVVVHAVAFEVGIVVGRGSYAIELGVHICNGADKEESVAEVSQGGGVASHGYDEGNPTRFLNGLDVSAMDDMLGFALVSLAGNTNNGWFGSHGR